MDNNIADLVSAQRSFFDSEQTLDLRFRIKQLQRLYEALLTYEQDLMKVVYQDFRKPYFETFGTEIALVKEEIKHALRHLPTWVKPKKAKTTPLAWPSKNYIYQSPYGVTLVIGAWNYPILLTLSPLVGAIAAGNCALIKPSELTADTAALIHKIIHEIYDPGYCAVVEGGPETTQKLLREKLDYIFFTGSERVGRIVMEAAARQLTPVTLELGGKSPCIVDEDADLQTAAKRIAWGKLVNGGQTCVAPDYLLVHRNVQKKLIKLIKSSIQGHCGNDPEKSSDFPRIINKSHFDRLKKLTEGRQVIFGGQTNEADLFIAPAILDDVNWDSEIMQEEIFGPILPIIPFDQLDGIIEEINKRPKPLALYYFSKSKKKQRKIIECVHFGGGCINDTLFHFGSPYLPIGGIGSSGIGRYRGKYTFETFSHSKSILKRPNWIDIPIRYGPYRDKLRWLKLIFKL